MLVQLLGVFMGERAAPGAGCLGTISTAWIELHHRAFERKRACTETGPVAELMTQAQQTSTQVLRDLDLSEEDSRVLNKIIPDVS